MSLLSELKRRNVFRVGVAYAVVAWLLIQIVTVIEEPLNLPEQFDTLTIVALAIGFPIALILAWALELTPEGIRATDPTRADGVAPPQSQKLNYLIIVGLALALVMVVVDGYLLRHEPREPTVGSEQTATSASQASVSGTGDTEGTEQEDSVAVLPFANLSSDPEQEYFADGLTEELINTLSAIDGMRVTGRISSFFFRGSDQGPAQIAETLGVNYLLQGSVRKSGEQLRIAATLTNAADGFNLWSDTFERELDDIFVVQREIADAVSTALSITLAAGEFDRPGLTANPQAYDEFLKAGAGVLSSAQDDMFDRIGHMERAVELDPDFALAWLHLSDLYATAIRFSPANSAEVYRPLERQAAINARTLAPDLPELRWRALLVDAFQNGDWNLLEQRLLDSMEESGSSTERMWVQLFFHSIVGHRTAALQYARRIYRRDPLDPVAIEVLAFILMELGDHEEAREHLNRGLEITDYAPGTPMFAMLAFLEMLEQNWEAAIAASRNLVSARDAQVRILEHIAANDFESGVREVRRLMQDPSTSEIVRDRHLNVLAALMNEPELALEITMNAPNPINSHQLMQLPFGDDVRTLPGYKALMDEFGLVNYWRTTGNWGDVCRRLPGGDDFECF